MTPVEIDNLILTHYVKAIVSNTEEEKNNTLLSLGFELDLINQLDWINWMQKHRLVAQYKVGENLLKVTELGNYRNTKIVLGITLPTLNQKIRELCVHCFLYKIANVNLDS